ncbi:MAG: hypothetical protein KAJ63_04310 [Methyloprofundus sp.]|nr:hypothetical protein [Methyloprofundus sp.]
MFKLYYSSALLLGLALSNNTMAACGDGYPSLNPQLIQNYTFCIGNFDAQEEIHTLNASNTGELWDFKQGDGHALDPRKQIGTWSTDTVDLNKITFTYFATPSNISYSFQLFLNGSILEFCGENGAKYTQATFIAGINIGCSSGLLGF